MTGRIVLDIYSYPPTVRVAFSSTPRVFQLFTLLDNSHYVERYLTCAAFRGNDDRWNNTMVMISCILPCGRQVGFSPYDLLVLRVHRYPSGVGIGST